MDPTIFETPQQLFGKEGLTLGPTDWLTIDQARIDNFAAATGDYQWIHVDPARAKSGPFGVTIAHGYLTLSLASLFIEQMLRVDGGSMVLNYGTNKVRFINPVRVGSRLRGLGEFLEIKAVTGGYQLIVGLTIEIEGEEKPACAVQAIIRYYS